MTDDKPSILSRLGGQARTPERDPEDDREARELTEVIKRRLQEALDQPPPATFDYDRKKLETLVNALKWHLPSAIDDIFQWQARLDELRALKKEVAADPSLPHAERAAKLRLLDKRIAGTNEIRMILDGAFSLSIRAWDANKEEQEILNRASGALLRLLPLLREAIRFTGISIQQGDPPEERLGEFFKL